MNRNIAGCRQGSITVLALMLIILGLGLAVLLVNIAAAEKKMGNYYEQELQARQALDGATEWVLYSLKLNLEQNAAMPDFPLRPIGYSKIEIDDTVGTGFEILSPGVELEKVDPQYCWYRFKAVGTAGNAKVSAKRIVVRYAYTDCYVMDDGGTELQFTNRIFHDTGKVTEYLLGLD